MHTFLVAAAAAALIVREVEGIREVSDKKGRRWALTLNPKPYREGSRSSSKLQAT